MEYVLAAAIIVLLVGLYIRTTFVRVTVFEFERGLKYSDGRFVGTLGPGRYWAYSLRF